MRVTHLIKTNGIAGAEGHLLVLLPGLRARGVDVRVVFIAPTNGEGEEFASTLEGAGVPVERVPIHNHGTPGMVWTLRQILRRHRPDVAHVHLFHAELYGIPAAKLAGVPRIIDSRHNDDPRRSKFPLRQFYRLLWAMTETGICISDAVRHLVEAEGAPPSKLRVIRYGLPPRAPQDKPAARAALRERLGLAPDALVFGTVSRLLDWKGIDDAIAAVGRLTDLPDAHLVVVGDGAYRPALDGLVDSLGLANRVHFLGWLPSTAPIHAGIDALVVPSHREGFGLITLEAMLESTPIIATRAGALPEIVVDGETGLLVPPQSPALLADAMRALADPARRQTLGEAGARRLRETFTADAMIDTTLRVYEGQAER